MTEQTSPTTESIEKPASSAEQTKTPAKFFKDWSFEHWAYLHGKPKASAKFKTIPEDFVVTENLGFELTGSGENVFLLIEKTELNTHQVCEYLAKFFGRRLRDIGYAGLKDKQSVSRQWFSIQMNITQNIDLTKLGTENIRLIEHSRHIKKLKIGALKSNHFDILLKDITDVIDTIGRLEQIKTQGVPNYFGLQRFGFKGNNLNWADRMSAGEDIKNRKIKGFALSASRSYIFNEVVNERLNQQLFDKALNGDVFILTGSNSYFSQDVDDKIIQRLQENDIQVSAPLFGKGEFETTGQVLELETQVAGRHANWQKMLVDNGLKQERRSILLNPENLTWLVKGNDLLVSFDLPTGCFATSILRECVDFIQEYS
jgi:tRNA pseudouridine13 synthase